MQVSPKDAEMHESVESESDKSSCEGACDQSDESISEESSEDAGDNEVIV